MTDIAHLWPFSPLTSMSPEQQQRWLKTCYVRTNVDELFADPARSIVVIAHTGSGLTTSLAHLNSYGLLAFQYDPDQWPGQPNAFTNAPDHFGQWMAHIAYRFSEEFKARPDLLERLTAAHNEFLVWLVRQYLGRRQSDIWLNYLRSRLAADSWQALSDTATSPAFEQLYGDTVADLYGQIDECLGIAQILGWRGIYATSDVNWSDWIGRAPHEREALAAGAKQLLTTLTPLQRAGFGIKMGVHQNLLSIQEARDLVRGRALVTAYEWPTSDLLHLIGELLQLATDRQFESADLLPDTIWAQLSDDIFSIWGMPGPAAAVALARHALDARAQPAERRVSALRYNLYRHSATLRLDRDTRQRLVWRGMTPITLEETPFRFFEVLWRHRGEPVSNEVLLQIAHTSENLDQNIRRIRRAIEPFHDEKRKSKEDKAPIYVQRTISSGTWLEKKTCHFS